MKKRLFRKGDILLIIGCLVLALGALLMLRLQRQEGAQVSVYVDGEWVSSYPLGENRTVRLTTPDGSSYNTLVIENGRADIIDAGCPDKLCVNMHSVAYTGETITCLPNKTVIKIEGGAPGGVDVY